MDRAERKRHEELEREMLLRAAKSRSKTEDPEQAKLKAKAKEMQRVEMEELRQREANATALQAIGPRKKPRLDGDAHSSLSHVREHFPLYFSDFILFFSRRMLVASTAGSEDRCRYDSE